MRRCGDCQLCCKLLPVQHVTEAGERCQHQRAGKGCLVYNTLQMPRACALWNCRWIAEDDTADLPRPDRAHYVIDIAPDFVTIRDNEAGTESQAECVQIWCDPDYPNAHRDPALRRFLDRQGKVGLVRFNSRDAITIFPPSIASDHKWHELHSGTTEAQHTIHEVAEALGGTVRIELEDRDVKRLAKMSSMRYRRRIGRRA